jgi:Flp pilus assembly protein TadG
MTKILLRRLVKSRDGSVLLETAVMITILLMLMFGIVDLGRALYTMNNLVSAVREGARVGAVSNTLDTLAVKDTVIARFSPFRFGGVVPTRAMISTTVSPSGCTIGAGCSSIKVRLAYPFNWLLPTRVGGIFGTTTMYAAKDSLRAQAEYHLETY